ncbi:hypothetical protein LJC47_06615, partial [Desulfosarcina sp. OttesenSCG-928-B08]|nr:hypothetical protein [Desulfosarcina sp. OttesenSCG-928-B08]
NPVDSTGNQTYSHTYLTAAHWSDVVHNVRFFYPIFIQILLRLFQNIFLLTACDRCILAKSMFFPIA